MKKIKVKVRNIEPKNELELTFRDTGRIFRMNNGTYFRFSQLKEKFTIMYLNLEDF